MVSIDPGRKTGIARWETGVLLDCDILTHERDRWHSWALDQSVVIERPTVYPRSPVPPNDIVELAITAGGLACSFDGPVEWVLPRTWKGTIPKEIMAERIIMALTPKERSVLDGVKCAASARHNVIDAIGLGLWHLKRLGR